MGTQAFEVELILLLETPRLLFLVSSSAVFGVLAWPPIGIPAVAGSAVPEGLLAHFVFVFDLIVYKEEAPTSMI